MKYDTFKEARYKYFKCLGHGEHVLINESGDKEIWFNNKYHASYGLIYKNTHLEYARRYIANSISRI